MKALINFPAICLAFIAISFFSTEKAKAQVYSQISVQTFYDELSPYGRWIHNPEYGYVWLPNAEPNFQPYATRGHWVMTEYGNTWVSDYEWGWAPFHYGRWYFDNYYGWAWVPGNEWGPAWVNWRTSNGYYGWAPLSPGMHIHMAVNLPINYWVFVPYGRIYSPRIYSYYVPRRRVVNVYHQSVVINNVHTTNNYTYISGPSRQEVERTTRNRVVVRNIDNAPAPNRAVVNRSSVKIYRPTVATNNNAATRPARVSPSNNVTRREAAQTGRSSQSNNQQSRSNGTVGRTENTSGNTLRERNASERENLNTGRRTATQAPQRTGQGSNEQQTTRTREVQSEPTRSRQDTQAAPASEQSMQGVQRQQPVQRRQESRIQQPAQRATEAQRQQPVQRSQETQTAPVQRRQEAPTQQPAQRRQQTQTPTAPAQRNEAPQRNGVSRSSNTQHQAPERRDNAQAPAPAQRNSGGRRSQ